MLTNAWERCSPGVIDHSIARTFYDTLTVTQEHQSRQTADIGVIVECLRGTRRLNCRVF
jgi:hypothetical protein